MPSVSEVVARLIDVLEASREKYALGGALALAAWAEPRATADVDLVLWVDESARERALALLESAGVGFARAQALKEAAESGMCVGHVGQVRVDVFFPSIPFYGEALGRRVRAQVAGRDTWIHSAEVLAVFKLLFFRPKDLVDLERMLEVQGRALDRAFVRASIEKMLGEDQRLSAWDELCARVRPAD